MRGVRLKKQVVEDHELATSVFLNNESTLQSKADIK
jgi:hypothetical protein